jgi:GAF domain-containing protein
VVGFAAQTRKPRLALDVGADAIFFNNPDLPETRSEIALPLIHGEEAIGVLDVQSTEAGAFSEEDFRALGTLANQLAIAIENTRLLSEARASARQVEEVYNEFVRTQWSHTSEKVGHSGFRYNAGRIEMLEPSGEEEGINSPSAKQVDPSERKRGKVAVPVKLRGEVIGMLQVEPNDPAKTWRTDELSLMEAVAERAALALENARLFQDARRRAAKERMIAEATSRITGSMNVENILQATAAELERVLGGSEVLIRFNSKDSV